MKGTPEMAQAEITATNDGLRTSYMITCADLEGLLEAVGEIEARYHPLGYGTSFQPPARQSDGSWYTHGSRANSCD